MNTYRDAVRDAVSALQIESPTAFTWLGDPVSMLPPEVAAAMDRETAGKYLRFTLRSHLYANFYTRGGTVRARASHDLQPETGLTPFVQSLSLANAGSGSRDPGWTVTRRERDGRVVVERDRLSLWARRDEILGKSTKPGARVSIRLPKELLRLSPGFYLALGAAELRAQDPIVRFYWHLRSDGSAALMQGLTEPLNEARLPFRLKVLKDPGEYDRCDAGVLYVRRRDFARVAPIVARVREAVAPSLRPVTPALTKRLADGLGLAEEPPDAESFGLSRCALIADGAVRAAEEGVTEPEERLAAVERSFTAAGVSLDVPYLNPDSADEYELPA